MASCRLMHFMVPDSHGGFDTGKAALRCETHDWAFDGAIPAMEQCPIGRIEEAADKAIARIREAGCGPTIIIAEDVECRSSCPEAPNGNI